MAQTEASCSFNLKSSWSELDIEEDVAEFLLKSCGESTWKNYNVYIKKWFQFCSVHNIRSNSVTIAYILKFLYQLYNVDKIGYSSINTARSALSLVLPKVDGSPVGSHPLVMRMIKAVSRERPPLPRYDTMWDANQVIDLFKKWDCNEQLDLKLLSFKSLALLALCSGHRIQTFASIKLKDVTFTSHVQILVPAKLKTTAPGRKQPCMILPFFDKCEKICPARCLREYINRSESLRKYDNLFISFQSPYKPVGTQSLSRWLREVLRLAAVDINVFKGQSFRHASTSKAHSQGVNIDVIYAAAGWSEGSSVFAKYYNRPIDKRDLFAKSVLQ